MQNPHGYGYPVPPPPNRPNGVSTLLIVVLVIGGLLVLGAGACLVGLVAYGAGSSSGPTGVESSTTTAPPPEPSPFASTLPVEPMPGPVPKPTPTVAKEPTKKKGPRMVDFVCPAGEPPQGIVRAGCMCGSSIYGTACGTGFRDVEATAKGCRFTCD